ncbi:hypothetical protein I4U23_007738 [Adineta vaga]|nr:hypothetical protein I4U23_007738 [Adineta vaga]
MTDNIEDLVIHLSSSTLTDDNFDAIINFLQNVDIKSLVEFISNNFNALLILENWAWKILSEDSSQWINQSKYIELLNTLALFNKNFIFNSNEMDSEKKVFLLLPQSKDIITCIFEQLEKCNDDDDDPYFVIISLWLNNFSYFMYEDVQYLMSSIVIDLEYSICYKYIMTEQYKIYLTELQQFNFSSKQLFYLQTCSFSVSSYLFCKNQKMPFTGEEILRYFSKEYLDLIQQYSFTVQSWSPKLLSCITQIINFIRACCWWSGDDKEKCIKIILPTKDISHTHIQSLIRILNYKPFHQEIQVQRSNDETILIDSIINFLMAISETYDIVCFMRTETKLIEILLPLAETSKYNRISLCAYEILGELLSDEHIKELKITSNLCEYFFYMLENAWNHPAQNFQRTSVAQLLRGFLNLAKNDSIQQKTADTNRVTLLIEMCDQYSIVFDILWALSFNHDIQHQLRSDRKLMLKLTHLKQELNNAQMRKITHGILWNLETMHEDHAIAENDDKIMFDIMISYSHKDKHLCKQIYDELIKSGYRVWIDFDQLHGNVMDAMAQAIERSNKIVICMSEQYRRSNYCRAEAHYAFQRQLPIIPILLEKHYKPDGWLLFLIGQLLYVDFTKYEFSQAIKMLFKELEAPVLQDHNVIVVESVDTTNIVMENTSMPISLTVSDNILDWTETDVQNWLVEHNLVQMSRLLSDYNGSNLKYLNRYLSTIEPQQILKLLQDDSLQRTNRNLSLIELARFQNLLDQQLSKLETSENKPKQNNHRSKSCRRRDCNIL